MNEIVTTWWTGMLMASAVIMFAIVGVHKLHEWCIYPLREMTRFVRRPWFERLLLLFFICGMIHYGATKGTNGMDNAVPPSPGLMCLPCVAVGILCQIATSLFVLIGQVLAEGMNSHGVTEQKNGLSQWDGNCMPTQI